MKKVCHLTIPHSRYDERIFLKECRSLSYAGYQVTLLCADNKPEELIDGVKIKSIPYGRKNKFFRIIGSKKAILKAALCENADIYHLHDPELLPLGLSLKKAGKKVIYDSHEDVPAQILNKDWIPRYLRKFLAFLFENYENYICARLDCIVTVTPHIAHRLSKNNPRTFTITNFPKIEDHFININRNPTKRICFAGGISKQWLHENIINALNDTEGVIYALAGLAESQQYFAKLENLKNWNRVQYLGYLNKKEVFSLYSHSAIGIALNEYNANVGYKLGSIGNTKLFEYMLAGIPIICTDFVLWKEIIEKVNCGICVNPHDIAEIAAAINYLIENPIVAENMGNNGQNAVFTKFNWSTQEKILFELYQSI